MPKDNSSKNNTKTATIGDGHRYWWIIASPNDEGWKDSNLVDYEIGQVQTYKLLKKDGKQLKVPQNFLDAKVGDIVIGHQAGTGKSGRKIVALCEVVASVNESDSDVEKNIKIKKVEHLKNPIAVTSLRKAPELSNMEALRNNFEGAFFKLTKKEFTFLMELIRRENP